MTFKIVTTFINDMKCHTYGIFEGGNASRSTALTAKKGESEA